MTDQSNPRKIYRSGDGLVVSLPQSLLDACDLEQGDRLVLTPTETGFEAEEVEWQVTSG